MSRRVVSRVLAALTLTMILGAPLHAATVRSPAHGGYWTRALAWLTRLISPFSPVSQTDKGGMMDPNGGS